jgi:L-ascorbate metabolism protein UlaG (beta-lactamase superfamily)
MVRDKETQIPNHFWGNVMFTPTIVILQALDQATQYTYNPTLYTCKQGWPGTPMDGMGRFMNHEYPYTPALSNVLKWKFGAKPQQQEKQADTFRLKTQHDTHFIEDTTDGIVWLGHASFFIRLAGINILIDPIFYDIPLTQRYTPAPFTPEMLPPLDYLLISHDHRDHCQEESIRRILALHPSASILTGLQMEKLLRPWAGRAPIQMAGWYQQYLTSPTLNIYFLPARHWAKRGIFDTNKRLWGAFVLQSQHHTLYFSSDTGYGSHFADAREVFPNIDIAIIGVGAYKPEWFMHPVHISPADAVRAFHDLGAKVLVPMHYGTFNLSDEPIGEPVRVLRALEKQGKIQGMLKVLDPGENYTV